MTGLDLKTLTDELRALGLTDGDAVLVHSSFKSLGQVTGGPEAVIDALLAAVGPEGTVLFPALTGNRTNGPGHPPEIDCATTPGWPWLGIIPTTARLRPDAIRSIHPTHSVIALGANCEKWTAGHEHSHSPCDESSPYFRLMENGGKILLLGGVTHESNTSLHCIEEIAWVPYHLQCEVTDGIVVMPDGERKVVSNRLHLWQDRYSDLKLEREFNKVVDPLTDAGMQRTRRIGNSISTLIQAGGMRDVLLAMIESDPLFLLKQP